MEQALFWGENLLTDYCDIVQLENMLKETSVCLCDSELTAAILVTLNEDLWMLQPGGLAVS